MALFAEVYHLNNGRVMDAHSHVVLYWLLVERVVLSPIVTDRHGRNWSRGSGSGGGCDRRDDLGLRVV